MGRITSVDSWVDGENSWYDNTEYNLSEFGNIHFPDDMTVKGFLAILENIGFYRPVNERPDFILQSDNGQIVTDSNINLTDYINICELSGRVLYRVYLTDQE